MRQNDEMEMAGMTGGRTRMTSRVSPGLKLV